MADIIKVNVGGNIYTTTRSTLTRYPNFMLGAMFSGRMPTTKDEDGNYWIDGNGDMFRYVLDFLRRGCLTLPVNFQGHELLEKEADFYQIPELIEGIREKNRKNYEKYVVVRIYPSKGSPRDLQYREGTATIFGSEDVRKQLLLRLKPYNGKNTDGKNIMKYKVTDSKITVQPFPTSILPMCALTLEILHLGFQNVDSMTMRESESFDLDNDPSDHWFIKHE